MAKKRLFLLDGMALVYRAHFALIRNPIFTSGGVNSSALFGFTNTLVDLIEKQKPTHLAVVFDTQAPTERHEIFPEYKAQRDAMPEDLAAAIPHVKRMAQAFRIPVIEKDGYEADDIIGTLAKRASAASLFFAAYVYVRAGAARANLRVGAAAAAQGVGTLLGAVPAGHLVDRFGASYARTAHWRVRFVSRVMLVIVLL